MQAGTGTKHKMRNHRRFISNSLFVRLALAFAIIYCYSEYGIHYATQMQCLWPDLKNKQADNVAPVHAMVLADKHLQGALYGHWFDKWRREFQMHRSFQTAMTLHKPEVVFVLGDLFDEGQRSSQTEFVEYVNRFKSLFKVPEGTEIYTVVGNTDIGLHYSKELVTRLKQVGVTKGRDDFQRMTSRVTKRFEHKMNSSRVQLITVRGNHFVLMNSMAMQGDGCSRAVYKQIKDILMCAKGDCKGDLPYSTPINIIMQHFPLYRRSDSIRRDPDRAPLPQRKRLFKQRWDRLSAKSTIYLVENLDPRAAVNGHTHNSCTVEHTFKPTKERKIQLTEYTVPSFNWRNRLDPKYYLMTITPDEIQRAKCEMVTEATLIMNAIFLSIVPLVFLWLHTRIKKAIHYKNLFAKQV